jgi:hypothetical protein
MTYYVLCGVDTQPCPPEMQMIAAEPSLMDYAALGLTGNSLTAAVSLGFGIIFIFACLGIVTASVIKMIKQM